MAVPGSGTITMLGLAQEVLFGTYGSGSIPSPITLFDLINGGGGNGFPALNTCPVNPTPTYSMSSWYTYDQNVTCGGCQVGDCCVIDFGYNPGDEVDACNQYINGAYTQQAVIFNGNGPQAPWEYGYDLRDWNGSASNCPQPAQPGFYATTTSGGGVGVNFWDGSSWGIAQVCR